MLNNSGIITTELVRLTGTLNSVAFDQNVFFNRNLLSSWQEISNEIKLGNLIGYNLSGGVLSASKSCYDFNIYMGLNFPDENKSAMILKKYIFSHIISLVRVYFLDNTQNMTRIWKRTEKMRQMMSEGITTGSLYYLSLLPTNAIFTDVFKSELNAMITNVSSLTDINAPAGNGSDTFTANEFDDIDSYTKSESDLKYLTGNQSISLNGDVSGSGTTSISVSINNSSVINKVLTGLSVNNSVIVSTDNLLTALGKTQGQLNNKQNSNTILTNISGLSTSTTGFIKLTNGVASLDTSSGGGITSAQAIAYAIYFGG